MKLNEQLKKLRAGRGLSMRKLALQLGVPASTYRGWEQGTAVPSHQLPKLAMLFGVPTAELIGTVEPGNEMVRKSIYYLEEALELLRKSQG